MSAAMIDEKPYSLGTLADRWGCSTEKVRTMYRDGEITGFRIGKMIRIPASEVRRIEGCGNPEVGLPNEWADLE
jgi:excisionase family DNA binding protein